MIQSAFGCEPNRVICDSCGEIVMRPVVYRGLRLHRGCARLISLKDYSEEVLAPRADEALRTLEEILDSSPESLT